MKGLTTEDTEGTEKVSNKKKISKTPETDEKSSNVIGFYSCATVPTSFARRLEIERDKAISLANDIERSYFKIFQIYKKDKYDAKAEVKELWKLIESMANVMGGGK